MVGDTNKKPARLARRVSWHSLLTPTVLITSVVLVASLIVILTPWYTDATQKWAMTTVGWIVGHFMKVAGSREA